MVEFASENPPEDSARLDAFQAKIETELQSAKELVRQRVAGLDILDFDIRGKLYALALELSPNARANESGSLLKMADLRGHERCVDIAAGTGLLTGEIMRKTSGVVYAIDPSKEQLGVLHRHMPSVRTIQGSPDDVDLQEIIPSGSIDVVLSQGGIHHVGDQRVMFENIADMLRPGGKCVCLDVCAGTDLARHFDEYVSVKCLTGHSAQWLNEERLATLTEGLPLAIVRTERLPLSWVFNSKREIALFFKGLHAYDLPEDEVLADLKDALGIEEKDGKFHVNWPLLFFHLQKQG